MAHAAAVIGLAPNLFYGTGLAACVLVLRRQKQPDEQGKILKAYDAVTPRSHPAEVLADLELKNS